MMKRGCEIIALHCDNTPYTESKAREKFNALVTSFKPMHLEFQLKSV
jgi:thiamine biosynthesis protein ThiI